MHIPTPESLTYSNTLAAIVGKEAALVWAYLQYADKHLDRVGVYLSVRESAKQIHITPPTFSKSLRALQEQGKITISVDKFSRKYPTYVKIIKE